MRFFGLVAAMLFIFSPVAWGQNKPKNVDEIAAYMGADREQMLLEGAKKEGKIVWYTSLAGGSYKTIAKEFEKKYPDVKLEVYRSSSRNLAPKLLNEAQAGRYLADAMESSPPILMLLRDKGLLVPYTSPALKKYPDSAKTIAGGGKIYWVNDRESFIGFGYNTKAVAEKDVPKNFEDLLKPAWTGKMGMSMTSTGDRVIGTMLKNNGSEYVEKLKHQGIKLFDISGSALRDLVINGEIAGSPTLFRNHVLAKIDQGAPIKWVAMDEVPTNAGGAVFIKNAPHPHAAILFLDFLIGDAGQGVLEKFHYGLAWKDYPFKRIYLERDMETLKYLKQEKEWHKLLRTVGRSQTTRSAN